MAPHEPSALLLVQAVLAPALANADRLSGGEEGRVSGLSITDPSHRRVSIHAVNPGSLSKQKTPANDTSASKEALLSSSTFLGRPSGSSRRAAVSSGKEAFAGSEVEPSRFRGMDASPGGFRRGSGAQRSSSVRSAEHKCSSSGRHPSNVKRYESTLKGIESLNFDSEERLQC